MFIIYRVKVPNGLILTRTVSWGQGCLPWGKIWKKPKTKVGTNEEKLHTKAYPEGYVAIDTDAQKSSVIWGSKCSSIDGKIMNLT